MPIVAMKRYTIKVPHMGKHFLFPSHMHEHVENRYMQLHNQKTRYSITQVMLIFTALLASHLWYIA